MNFKKEIEKLENAAFGQKNQKISREVHKTLKSDPAVYFIYENGVLIYIGETKNVKGRVGNMFHSTQHNLRRNFANENLTHLKGFERLTQKKKPSQLIDLEIKKWFDTLEIKIQFCYFGRSEFEESMIRKYKTRYNKLK